MENVSEALIMGGQILIFILALTICISSFSTLREGVMQLIGQEEAIELVEGSNGYINYISSRNAEANRVVNIETVVCSLYRSIKENYVVYIIADNCENFKSGISNNLAVDLMEATQELKIGDTVVIPEGKKILKVTIGHDTNQYINAKLKAGLYKNLKGLSFYEYLGEYQNASDVTSENKETFRIITYIEKGYYENLL